MAVSLELRVCNLLTEFLANALILLSPLQTAGAVASGTLQTVLHHLNSFLIFVKSNSHSFTSLLFVRYLYLSTEKFSGLVAFDFIIA